MDGFGHIPSRKKRLVWNKVAGTDARVHLDALAGDFHHRSARALLLRGDAAAELVKLPAGIVHTCLTSPPYWQARDYGHDGQIGREESAEEYVRRIVEVFAQVKRVLVDEGTAWLNLGDTYLKGVGTVDGRPPSTGWRRNKQLSLIPFRVAIALQEDGWWVRNAAVWHKPNAMPESVDDRLSNAWEPVFLLTKGERYFFDLDPIREAHRTDDTVERRRAERGTANGKAKGRTELRKLLTSPRHRATIDGMKEVRLRPYAPESTELAAYLREALGRKRMTIHAVATQLGEPFERVRHYFRTDAIGSRLPPEETWPRLKAMLDLDDRYDEAMTVVVTDNVFRNHPNGRNPGDVIAVPTARSAAGHFATMPEALAERCLKATLPPGGICLDPFMGTGTTGRVALALGGRFVGADVDAGYMEDFQTFLEGDLLSRGR